MFPEKFPQCRQQDCIFRKALHQNLTRAIQCGLDIGNTRIIAIRRGKRLTDIPDRFFFGIQQGVFHEAVCQLVQFRLDRQFRTCPALGTKRQINILKCLFILRLLYRRKQFRSHLVLRTNGIDHRLPPLFEFPQIDKPFLQKPQLTVVKPARHFLAISRDKRNRRPFIE